jgi:hypothetical protein
MNPKNPPEGQNLGNVWNPTESERSERRRMREVLGINGAGIEVILRLRSQVTTLQARLRQLETELAMLGGWTEHTPDAASRDVLRGNVAGDD